MTRLRGQGADEGESRTAKPAGGVKDEGIVNAPPRRQARTELTELLGAPSAAFIESMRAAAVAAGRPTPHWGAPPSAPLAGAQVPVPSAGPRGSAAVDEDLTRIASHVHTIADTFGDAMVGTRLGEYTIEMTAPDESTKGGLLALQHLRLHHKTGMAIVVGTVSAMEKSAELHSFAYFKGVYEQRFKRAPPFNESAYRGFLERAERVLAGFGLEVRMTAPLEVEPHAAAERASRISMTVLILLAMAVALLAFFYLR